MAKSLDRFTDPAGQVLSAYDLAVTRSISSLKRKTIPVVRRAVREHYSVKAKTLSGQYRVETGIRGRKRSDRSDYVGVWASTRAIPLLEFEGRWSGVARKNGQFTPGASATVVKGVRRSYKGAFIATINGVRAIRARKLLPTGRRAARGPLRRLKGPSPFEMLSGLDYEAAIKTRRTVLAELTEFYTSELRRQFTLTRG